MKTTLFVATMPLLMVSAAFADDSGMCYGLRSTCEILVTSEAGDRMAVAANVPFREGNAGGTVIIVRPNRIRQTVVGIGTSFTEASAFVLASLDRKQRREVMERIFGEKGANFSLARTHIGSCDFSVKGKYSYADVEGDVHLAHFSIAPDSDGFDREEHPGIRDPGYDLLPMIKEALDIKGKQDDQTLKIIASAWTAPRWMKDIEEWYIPGSPDNDWQGTGGVLKEEYVSIYADYLVRYLKEYKREGVDIWGLTPVNEPHGNNGNWESMHFSPSTQNDFVKDHLGPRMRSTGFGHTKLLVYDQNRDGLEEWADTILGDAVTNQYVYGVAVHWYEGTVKVYEDVFEAVHAKFPDFAILHTEGCIDDLGKNAPQGITDPDRYKEHDWFDNDAFWWNQNATDWAYSATWDGVKADEHPIYTPVHRYARNIIVSLNHWVRGWVDWNIVLDRRGGPNHVGNYCGAPIMVDLESGYVYYTPIFSVLEQLSRTIRPGDRAVETSANLDVLDPDALHACATINSDNLLSVQVLNTTKDVISCSLQIGSQHAALRIPPNSVQTIRVQL